MGATTVWQVSSLSKVLAGSKASRQLKRLDHFWLTSSNLASVETLADLLLSEAVLAGLSELDLALDVEAYSFSTFLAFFSSGPLKPGDCNVPWPSTAPITDTKAGPTREGLGEALVDVEITSIFFTLLLLDLTAGDGELGALFISKRVTEQWIQVSPCRGPCLFPCPCILHRMSGYLNLPLHGHIHHASAQVKP